MMRSTKELRHVYRDFLLEANQSYSDIVVLEADLSSSMATNNLEKDFGDRYVNVGIMEAEMVGLAAGLSIQGFRPYLHTFGPFASRRNWALEGLTLILIWFLKITIHLKLSWD